VSLHANQVLARSIAWLENAVIGLNLCPFAKAVHRKKQIRWQISEAVSFAEIDLALEDLLRTVADADASIIDTAILVLPNALAEFFDFNIYLAQANTRLRQMGLEGHLQIASFHPRYCFDGQHASDITNATNQGPYPMLHILREASLTAAVESYPDTETIVLRNQQTMLNLGDAGWQMLQSRF
jgi:uncharacterized protein